MKNRYVLLMLFITTVLLFISCIQEETADKTFVETNPEIILSDISEHYKVGDFSDLGVWAFTVDQEEITKRLTNDSYYVVEINNRYYPLKKHKINKTLLISFLDEDVKVADIKNGIIKRNSDINTRNQRTENSLCVERVIIQGEETNNGTNTYEITLEDYIQLKEDKSSMIFSSGTLIRPAFVKSNEENTYTLKTYYDARQVAADKTTRGAFTFLKEKNNHKELLFFGNANRVAVAESGAVTITSPDDRDRLRQLGEEGELSGANVFSIIKDDANSRYLIKIDRDVLVQEQKYANTYCYETELKSTTDCELNQTTPDNIYQTSISYADGVGTELIRNSRFTGDLKLTLYANTGEKKASYNHMSEAVKAAQSGDTIKANRAVMLNESTQSHVNGIELTITSDCGMFTLDYTGSATRAFILTGTASLSINNTIIQNIAITEHGAAFLVQGDSESLTVKSSVIGTNTSVNFGGAFSLFKGHTIVEESTITNNSNTGNGGAIYNNSLCTVKNCHITGNHANVNGGAIYNAKTLHFYNNTVASNTSNNGNNGLLLHENSIVYNSAGEKWRYFNSPHTTINLIEKLETAENTYINQGTDEGDCIKTKLTKETGPGTLIIKPSTATEFERKIIEIEYETGGFFAEGSITIDSPDDFTITADSSVTIGTGEATTAVNYTYNAGNITINGINAEGGTKIKLTLLADIPTGYVNPVQTRNIVYSFDAIADADGSGTAWSTSQKSTVNFISYNKSINTDFRLKSGIDYLRLITDNATEILFDEQTAAQTTVASITQAIESTDGSVQNYRIDTAGSSLSPTDNIPTEATLTVTAEHGNSFEFSIHKENGDFKLIRTTGRYSLHKTLTKAIKTANTGEKYTIECSATTEIKEPEIIINTAKEITIKPAANVTQITLNGVGTHRILNVSGDASITLKSTIIKNGSTTSNGGGIYFSGTYLSLEDCTVKDNYCVTYGGGIYLGGGKLRLSNTTVQYNISDNKGGGIYITPNPTMPTLQFDSGSIIANDAQSKGGGIFRNAGNIYTSYGCWNAPPYAMMPGDYNINFSVDTDGKYRESDLSHPAKVYDNSATQGSQMTM